MLAQRIEQRHPRVERQHVPLAVDRERGLDRARLVWHSCPLRHGKSWGTGAFAVKSTLLPRVGSHPAFMHRCRTFTTNARRAFRSREGRFLRAVQSWRGCFSRSGGSLSPSFSLSPRLSAVAQDIAPHKITLLPDTDLPGFDYSVVKDTTLDACEAACADDRICRAFTFNEKAKWCFLKSDAGEVDRVQGCNLGQGRRPRSDAVRHPRSANCRSPPATSPTTPGPSRTTCGPPIRCPKAPSTPISWPPATKRSSAKNPAAAILAYRQALAINNNDPALWLKLADAHPRSARDRDLRHLRSFGSRHQRRNERLPAVRNPRRARQRPQRARLCARAPRDVARVDRDLPRHPRPQG